MFTSFSFLSPSIFFFFFLNDPATTEIYPLSLHDALPIYQIAGALPNLGRAKVALQRIADLSARFASPEPHLHLDSPPGEVRLDHGLELRGVRYAFDAPEGGKAFEIGPIDLKLGKGELVFVVGDNGSGKTTLIKLLLGLYAPQQGEILHDGQPVTALAR